VVVGEKFASEKLFDGFPIKCSIHFCELIKKIARAERSLFRQIGVYFINKQTLEVN
jgi:hypothetical protein